MYVDPEIRNCEVCGKKFTSWYRCDKIYCSELCGKKAYAIRISKQKQRNKETRNCRFCGIEFTAKRDIDRCCSTKCNIEYYKAKKREKNQERLKDEPIPPRDCDFCKNTFIPSRRCNEGQRFCSPKCKIDQNAKEQRDARTEARSKITRTCPICDKKFTPKRTLKEKYCSARCRNLFPKKIYKALQTCYTYTGNKKQDHSHKLLGYTPRQLQARVQGHPNWQAIKNADWHLDHVFPIIAFLEHGIKDIALMCCLENLRPIAGKANCSKNDTYDKADFELWLSLIS